MNDYEGMCDKAAELIVQSIKKNPAISMGLATGATPVGVYKRLVNDHKKNNTSYDQLSAYNLDEYIGLQKSDINSYHYFMYNNLFKHININKNNCHLPDGMAADLYKECSRYESMINSIGGVDIQLLGLGENGHIGFNEPGTAFSSVTHLVKLEEKTRKVNGRFFQSFKDVPAHAITMGISTILRSKQIILLVSGKNKSLALAECLNGKISPKLPASALQLHGNVKIIADKEALEIYRYTIRN